MNTNKDYLDAMNQLKKVLGPADQDYFEKLRGYMGMSSLLKDEKAINQQLYQMHLDFMNAQEDGLSAEEFFGNDPKAMADQLLEEIPRTSFKTFFQYVGIVAVIIWGTRFLSDFSESAPVVINPALYIFDLVLVFSLIVMLFKLIQVSVYRKAADKKFDWLEIIGATLVFIFYIIIYLTSDRFIPVILPFTVSRPWSLFLFVMVLLSFVFLFWNLRKTAKRVK